MDDLIGNFVPHVHEVGRGQCKVATMRNYELDRNVISSEKPALPRVLTRTSVPLGSDVRGHIGHMSVQASSTKRH